MFQVKRANLPMVRIKVMQDSLAHIDFYEHGVKMLTGKMYKCLTLWSDPRSRVVQ